MDKLIVLAGSAVLLQAGVAVCGAAAHLAEVSPHENALRGSFPPNWTNAAFLVDRFLSSLPHQDSEEAASATPDISVGATTLTNPAGVFELGKHLGSGRTSSSFEATKTGGAGSEKKYVIRYGHNCETILLGLVHPITADFALASTTMALSGTVSMPMVYLSPPVKIPVEIPAVKNPKVATKGWNQETWNVCHNHGGEIRYSIQEKSGSSVKSVGKLSGGGVVESMMFGVQLVDVIENLHNAGITHGAIRASAVAFKTAPADSAKIGQDEIVLLHFDSGKLIAHEFGTNEVRDETFSKNLAVLSPWELRHFRSSRRDDVYRAMEVVLNVLTKMRAVHAFSTEVSLEEGIRIKSTGSLFDTEPTVPREGKDDVKLWDNPFESVDEAKAKEAAKILEGMMQNILTLKIDQSPNYEMIKESFANVIKIIK